MVNTTTTGVMPNEGYRNGANANLLLDYPEIASHSIWGYHALPVTFPALRCYSNGQQAGSYRIRVPDFV